MHAYIHTYIHTYMHTYIHTYIHVYVHVYMYVCTYMYTCIYLLRIRIRTYIYIYICGYMYVYIYIYTCHPCLKKRYRRGSPASASQFNGGGLPVQEAGSPGMLELLWAPRGVHHRDAANSPKKASCIQARPIPERRR